MAGPSSHSSKLSPVASKIQQLIDSHGSGSQRKFSRKVGCSQSVISRVLTGKQEPRHELLEQIAKLEGVDRDELFQTLKTGVELNQLHENLVPVADCLLDSEPLQRKEQLSDQRLSVSSSFARPSVYAVAARNCEPAFSNLSMSMEPSDFILVESSRERFRNNLQMLNEKLCVIRVDDSDSGAVTLQKVFIKINPKTNSWIITTDGTPEPQQSEIEHKQGPLMRNVILTLEDAQSHQTQSKEEQPCLDEQQIPLNQIVGYAIQLIRHL